MKISRVFPATQSQQASAGLDGAKNAETFQRVMAAVQSGMHHDDQRSGRTGAQDITLLQIQFDNQSVGFVGPPSPPRYPDVASDPADALSLVRPTSGDLEMVDLVSDMSLAAGLSGYPISSALARHFLSGKGSPFRLDLARIESAGILNRAEHTRHLPERYPELAHDTLPAFRAYFSENPVQNRATLLFSEPASIEIDPSKNRDAFLSLNNPKVLESVDALRDGKGVKDVAIRLRGADHYDFSDIVIPSDTDITPFSRLQRTGLATPFKIALSRDVLFRVNS
ncbi:hypothetical protein [Thalassococcus sp. S3]|uniref:hypothetical protein n=1 Tax=Thalassococcus sp. S3 TaxID=2017482 RepID=UPI0010248313|nr:hypothetical protein [Thalassococcus sp. S3]QBF33390.1 hypothetical protein CFI11_19560 [Thalassococcus sp. S3]